MQAVQKARQSPDFAAKAASAQAAYLEQMEDAAAAVEDFVEHHGLLESQRLTWQHRPKVPQVDLTSNAIQSDSIQLDFASNLQKSPGK